MKKGKVVEIALLGFLAIGLVILVVMSLVYGPLNIGTLQTVKFAFESGYSNELSTTSMFVSKSNYPLTKIENLVAEYTITGDNTIKNKINDTLGNTFSDKYVELVVEGNTITSGTCSKYKSYVVITRKIPLLDGNATEAKLWVFNCE